MNGLRSAMALALLVFSGPAVLGGQQRRCIFHLVNVDREGLRVEVLAGVENYYAGGNVRMECEGQQVRMRADSVVVFQGAIAQFIGNVRYEDSVSVMTADFGTYLRDGEKWEARQSVVFTNLQDGTNLTGPFLDYYRPLEGVRSEAELYAQGRPTIRIAADSSTSGEEPYTLVGNQVRMRGNERFWAGGQVTIDRSDLHGKSDSLEFSSIAPERTSLIGRAHLSQAGRDSFDLTGARIDLDLEGRQVTYTLAQSDARLVGDRLDLTADTIGLEIEDRAVVQTLAWGDSVLPRIDTDGYQVRADSLAVDSPGQILREVRGFGRAWAGFSPSDSTADEAERDWIMGDTLYVVFRETSDTAAPPSVERLKAVSQAGVYYRMQNPDNAAGAGLNYTRADSITVYMATVGDSTRVDRVVALGRVDGVQLQPGAPLPPRRIGSDSTGAVLRRPSPGGQP